jgi:hypothetical protein
MELGGKNSAIVLHDADIDKAVQQCIAGSFALVCRGNRPLNPLSINLSAPADPIRCL